MAALNFPDDRTGLVPPGTGPLQNGDIWRAPNGVSYTWNTSASGGYWSATFQSDSTDTLSATFLRLDADNSPLTGSLGIGSANQVTLNTDGSASFAKKVTSEATVTTDSDTTLVTKGYLQGSTSGSGGGGFVQLKSTTQQDIGTGGLSVNGSVGIGTTTTTGAKLTVGGSSATGKPAISVTEYNANNSTTSDITLSANGVISAADQIAFNVKSGYISFNEKAEVNEGKKNSTEYMRIASGGSVGINKTAPASRLHVAGTTTVGANGGISTYAFNQSDLNFSTEPALQVTGSTSAYAHLSVLRWGNSASGQPAYITLARTRGDSSTPTFAAIQSGDQIGRINFAGYDGAGFRPGASIVATAQAAPIPADDGKASQIKTKIEFYTDTNAAVTINADSNVGIGTTSPQQKLHVSTGNNNDGTEVSIGLGGNTVNGRQAVITKTNTGADNRPLKFYSSPNNTGERFEFYPAANNLALKIENNGNVGINTDASEKLCVRGDVTDADDITNPVILLNDGSGSNKGHKDNEGPAIGFQLIRNNDGVNTTSGFIKLNAEGDLGASWPASLSFGLRRFQDVNEVARFTSRGYFGLGTSDPTSTMEIKTPSTTLSLTTVREGSNYRNSGILFNTPRSNTNDGQTHGGRGMIVSLGNKDNADGILWLNAATASLTTASTDAELKALQNGLRMDSSGNIEHWHDNTLLTKTTDEGRVGILEASPEAFLHITNPVTTETAGVPSIYLASPNTVANTSDIALTANSCIRGDQSINHIVNTNGYFTWNVGGTDVKAGKAGSTEVARIDKSGNATFIGSVTANGSILTRASGTLDVGDRLEKVDAALQLLKTEAAAATTIAGLKTAIANALANI